MYVLPHQTKVCWLVRCYVFAAVRPIVAIIFVVELFIESHAMSEVTRILSQIEDGDPSPSSELLPLVYEELRKLAAARLRNEKPDQTLQATALVHEAYLRLVDVENQRRWDSRGHFFAAAAESMRRILVENARKKQAKKRSGNRHRVDLDQIALAIAAPCDDVLALNEALEKLEAKHKLKAEVVKLRFFAGLTIPQVAQALGISTSTADNYWAYARAWLRVEISADKA
jgi:RNA polymerase sigma factor (TIGR02999 family)